MSVSLLGCIIAGVMVVNGVVCFFWGFVIGRVRGHAEGYRRAWGLMAGGDRR